MPNLGEFVLQLLRKQGKSLRALARETGVSNSYLSDWPLTWVSPRESFLRRPDGWSQQLPARLVQ
jgi:transcriptional regulator with XRE-family HTH domain